MKNQKGYLLISVVVTLFIISAVTLMMSQESLMESNQVNRELQNHELRYVTEAAIQHAEWTLQQQGCGPFADLSSTSFGNHSYSAIITPNEVDSVITTYNVPVTDDAWIKSDTSTLNYGNDAQLSTFFNIIPFTTQRALYRFDIENTGIPVGTPIASAVAKIFIIDPNDTAPVSAHQVTADWTESTVNWDNINTSHDLTAITSIPTGSAAGEYVSVNITPLVQGWINGSTGNQGIMLKTASIGDLAQFSSKEYGNASQRPFLEIKTLAGTISKRADISATGSLNNGVSKSLNRSEIVLYQATPNSLTLQPDATAGKDTWLYEWKSTWNYGADSKIWVDEGFADSSATSLLQFQLDSIPIGAKIVSASLALHQNTPNLDGGPVGVHRINTSWDEGSSGGGAGISNWTEKESGIDWTTVGGDYDTKAITTSTVTGSTIDWSEWDIAMLVQDWVDGKYENYGLALVAESSGTAAHFDSSDHTDPTLRPKLTITYTCECGISCQAPSGSGNILMVVGDDSILTPNEVLKKSLFESWGYGVNLINENTVQLAFDTAASNNDVVYLSESAADNTVASKLTELSIGVVSEQGLSNDELGLATSASWQVGSTFNITDTTHYITSTFSAGLLELYTAGMEGLAVSGTEAPGLQVLGDWQGSNSLVVLEAGAAEEISGTDYMGDGTASGRRVLLPIGREAGFNWKYFNNNGRLLIQRAIQWGTGIGTTPIKNLLMVVVDPLNLTVSEADKKTQVESWGYTVNLIDEAESQTNFDAALASNAVVYIPETINPANVGSKLTAATIGIVNEEKMLLVELGFSRDFDSNSRSEIVILDNSHSITSGLALGTTTILTSNQPLTFTNSGAAPGAQTLAETNQVASFFEPSLLTLETNAALWGGGFSAGRRVALPWGDTGFNISALNADGLMIMQRAIEWAAGAVSVTPTKLLFVVANVGGPGMSAEEIAHQALLESWGYEVQTIDDGDGQAAYDAALALNDVVYLSEEVNATNVGTKLVNASIGVVTSEANLSAEFGLSGGVAWDSGTDIVINDNGHYITQTFATGSLTIFTASESLAYLTGSLAPDLSKLASSTSGFGVVSLDAGATMSSGGSAAGRRVQLPWGGGAFSLSSFNDDGRTLLRRSLEWGAGAGVVAVPTGPIAHWKLDETNGLTAVDSIGGHDAMLTNGPNWVTGQIDGALDFDGSNDFAITNNNFTPPAIGTVTFWMQVPGSPAAHGRILWLDDSWEIRHVTTGTPDGIPYGLVFDLGVSGVNTEFVTSVPINTPGQWYHIAAAYNTTSNAYAVYIDGALHKSGTYSSSLAVPVANRLSLGTRTGTTDYFDGILDDVRIYDTMLSATDVTDLYSASSGGGGPEPTTCSGTYRDEFNTKDVNGSNGTLDWSTSPWVEVGETDGITSGDIQIMEDDSNDGHLYRLRIRDNNNGGEGVEREVNLNGAVKAMLSLNYRRQGLGTTSDYVAVYASSTGTTGSWTELIAPRIEGGGSDTLYQTFSRDISDYISSSTAIRLRSSPTMGNNDTIYFDNIEISCTP